MKMVLGLFSSLAQHSQMQARTPNNAITINAIQYHSKWALLKVNPHMSSAALNEIFFSSIILSMQVLLSILYEHMRSASTLKKYITVYLARQAASFTSESAWTFDWESRHKQTNEAKVKNLKWNFEEKL